MDDVERLILKYRTFEDHVLIDLRDNSELTDDAVLAVNQVLSERKVNSTTQTKEEQEQCIEYADGGNLVTVAKFATPTEAYVFSGCLQSEGIGAFVADANLLQANPFMTSIVGWVRVQVSENDIEQARQILSDYQSGKYTINDDGELINQSQDSHPVDPEVIHYTGGFFTSKDGPLVYTARLLVKFVILMLILILLSNGGGYF
ncbi:MAG: DUF2007 domain-containing protein [Gammaproteobacteria bacterium]|nr:MAG: DUF2007 domain-containing protein [Gammaproteobacteria bacterium]